MEFVDFGKSGNKLLDSALIQAVGLVTPRSVDDKLPLRRGTGQSIGHGLTNLVVLVQRHPLSDQVVPDDFQPGKLGFAGTHGLSHMVTHSAGEFVALLLELIEELFHLGGLLADFGGGHHPGVGVGVNQTELLQCRRYGIRLHDAGHLCPFFRVICLEQFQGRPATMAGDGEVPLGVIGVGPDADGLLEADGSDIGCQGTAEEALQSLQTEP